MERGKSAKLILPSPVNLPAAAAVARQDCPHFETNTRNTGKDRHVLMKSTVPR